jgi:murein DD-endopeptidase MepM/ murein hydrolase activator NlpD
MMRTIAAVSGGLVVAGAAGAGGTALQGVREVLSSPVAPGTAGVNVEDGPDHIAVLTAPPATPILAVSSGMVDRSDAARLRVHGMGDDSGLDVEYAGMAAVVATPVLLRGDRLGAMPASALRIRAWLDGTPLDAAALLRAALGESPATAGDWVRPVDGAVVTQPFGCTPYAFEPIDRSCPSGHVHTGIDLAAPLGTPVRAALPGTAHVVASITGYGLHVVVDHGDGLTTLYAHLQSAGVLDGDDVDAGDLVGTVGSSGNSTGPHLHFEVRRDGLPEDPTLDVSLP